MLMMFVGVVVVIFVFMNYCVVFWLLLFFVYMKYRWYFLIVAFTASFYVSTSSVFIGNEIDLGMCVVLYMCLGCMLIMVMFLFLMYVVVVFVFMCC